uniref:Uncharacterized protein n=1 Tax=Thermosporothrix sp. COM3 TaxID=2490863 RepID=A0A455SIN0_9CHLR|nr:hypothetical protein KTC_15330 [Thermosporothrix sp. COM3]
MRCPSCGFDLPPGAPACPRCGQPVQYSMPPQKRNTGLIVTLSILGALLLIGACVCAGIFALGGAFGLGLFETSNYSATETAEETATSEAEITATAAYALSPTPYTELNPPSGNTVSSSAEAKFKMTILTDSKDGTTSYDVFNSGQTIYASFDVEEGAVGYVTTKWYFNGDPPDTGEPLEMGREYGGGYYSHEYYESGYGAVEFYWCSTSSCSDEKLAAVKTFQVK